MSTEDRTRAHSRAGGGCAPMTAPLLTEAQIVELRELRAKATPGLWFVDPDDRPGMGWNNHICAGPHLRVAFMAHDGSLENDRGEANAALIVAAVNALPSLLAAAERLAEGRPPEWLREVLLTWADEPDETPLAIMGVLSEPDCTLGDLRALAASQETPDAG